MAQRRSSETDPFADLDKKVQILEREMALQTAAIERLKALGQRSRREDDVITPVAARKTA